MHIAESKKAVCAAAILIRFRAAVFYCFDNSSYARFEIIADRTEAICFVIIVSLRIGM